jgi:hypothetical protein
VLLGSAYCCPFPGTFVSSYVLGGVTTSDGGGLRARRPSIHHHFVRLSSTSQQYFSLRTNQHQPPAKRTCCTSPGPQLNGSVADKDPAGRPASLSLVFVSQLRSGRDSSRPQSLTSCLVAREPLGYPHRRACGMRMLQGGGVRFCRFFRASGTGRRELP